MTFNSDVITWRVAAFEAQWASTAPLTPKVQQTYKYWAHRRTHYNSVEGAGEGAGGASDRLSMAVNHWRSPPPTPKTFQLAAIIYWPVTTSLCSDVWRTAVRQCIIICDAPRRGSTISNNKIHYHKTASSGFHSEGVCVNSQTTWSWAQHTKLAATNK